MKYVIPIAAGLGLLFWFAVLVGKMIALGNRHYTNPKQRLTVVWRDTDVMQCSFTGVVEPLGDHHIKVTDDAGWPVVVDTHDVIAVY